MSNCIRKKKSFKMIFVSIFYSITFVFYILLLKNLTSTQILSFEFKLIAGNKCMSTEIVLLFLLLKAIFFSGFKTNIGILQANKSNNNCTTSCFPF